MSVSSDQSERRHFFPRLAPFIDWFRGYNPADFRADFIAGLTVAFVVIPQSMAYARIAGLPLQYGLYAALVPSLVAALLGHSRLLATGPVAIIALITATALEPLAVQGTPAYIAYAVLLSLIVGIVLLIVGAFRLSAIINVLSHPVMNGFINGAAVIIMTSQLPQLFGVVVDEERYHFETVYNSLKAIPHQLDWATVGMAALAIAIILGLKRLRAKWPEYLIALAVTTALSWAIGFEHNMALDLGTIQSPTTRAALSGLDSTATELRTLSTARATLVPAPGTETAHGQCAVHCHRGTQFSRPVETFRAHDNLDEAARLELAHQSATLALEIERHQQRIHTLRARLHALEFARTTDANGHVQFYLIDSLPPGTETDGRTWRLALGKSGDHTMVGGGRVIGDVPRGLPRLAIPFLEWDAIRRLIPMAIVIAVLGFVGTVSIARSLAINTGQKVDTDQEIFAQGAANIAAAFTQGFPVAVSFARSILNWEAGARTGVANLVAAAVVGITLVFLTPLLHYLPHSVLAAVIVLAAYRLVSFRGIVYAWRARPYDAIIGTLTFVATLIFAPHIEWGILIGVALSLVVAFGRHMRPRVVVLARHPDGTFRDFRRWDLPLCKHISIIRFNGALFFGSAVYLQDQILDRVAHKPELRHVILDCRGLSDIDASGVETLVEITRRLKQREIDLCLASLIGPVRDVLDRTGVLAEIGRGNIYRRLVDAVEAVQGTANSTYCQEECPLAHQ